MDIPQFGVLVEHPDLRISRYLGQKSVGVYIRGRRGAANSDVYELPAPHSDFLGDQTGAELGAPDQSAFFSSVKEADTHDRERWDEPADWLEETTSRYEAALQTIAD